ncbi:MAG: transporter related [Bacillota bacterium]|jgi:putative ABC transport system ATP-binding protein|nr:transporter related [Bacillota bacterium]
MNVLRAENISKSYQMGEIEVKALQEACFEIKEGEFVVILGPSGSGKSTLLNIIGGMDQPTAGKVFLYDEEITGYNERQLTQYRRDKVGFVFQFYNIMANLTAEENVELATEISQKPLPVDQVLEAVGLGERKDHFPAQMSGGEQQRVSIARAVAKNPEILLCDEPTGALDFHTGITILGLLRKVNREMGKTVIVITHNSDIASMADRVIKMRSGRIIDDRVNENPMAVEEIKW